MGSFCMLVLAPLTGFVTSVFSLMLSSIRPDTDDGQSKAGCQPESFDTHRLFGCFTIASILSMLVLSFFLDSLSPLRAGGCVVFAIGTVFAVTLAWTSNPKLRQQFRNYLKALLFGSDTPPKPTQPTAESDITNLQRQVSALLKVVSLTDQERNQRRLLLEEIEKHTDQVRTDTDDTSKSVAACGDMAQQVKAVKQHQLSQDAQAVLDSEVAANNQQVIEKLKSVKDVRLKLEKLAARLTLDLAKQSDNRLSPEEALAAAKTAIQNARGLPESEDLLNLTR